MSRPAVCVVADIIWWLPRVCQSAKGAAQASSGPGVLPKDHRPVQFWWSEGMHITKRPVTLLVFWLLFLESYLCVPQSYLCFPQTYLCYPSILPVVPSILPVFSCPIPKFPSVKPLFFSVIPLFSSILPLCIVIVYLFSCNHLSWYITASKCAPQAIRSTW